MRQFPGPTNSIVDVEGLEVGHVTRTDPPYLTGVTVVLAREGAIAGVDVRGGGPGTRETDVLDPRNLVERVHAVLLAGGSAYGLDAASGVMAALEERGIGFPVGPLPHEIVPIVPAAVLYDLRSGTASARPDERSGYAACVAAADTSGAQLACGSWGAGTGATVAKIGGIERAMKGGIASASERLSGEVVVAALVAVNATGDIWDACAGRPIATPRADEHGQRPNALELLRSREPKQPAGAFNTTLTVIATNATLSRNDLLRVAEMTHAGLARAIVPYLGPGDGDVVFALATGGVPKGDLTAIGALAGLAAARAVARGVRAAESLGGFPSVSAMGEPAV
jgi:L-aminopeptidase/D-esterase-like protein